MVLWMPPVHEPHAVYRIQHHLGSTLVPSLLPALEWRVLEHQADAVVSHICAHIDCELQQRQRHKIANPFSNLFQLSFLDFYINSGL